MSVACASCASTRVEAFWDERLVRCTACGLVRAADRYFECDPAALYDAGYYSGPRSEYVDYARDRWAATLNARRRVAILRRLLPGAARLLEIGAGYGYFLETASRRWLSSGIEVSAHAAAEARSQNLRCDDGDYLSMPAATPPPDIVCLWDTIEHLVDPRRTLQKAADEISSGGVIAISTGDIGAWLPRVQRGAWRLIHPPTHLWYFSVATLTRLLDAVGFRVMRVVRPMFYRSLRLYVRPWARYVPDWLGDVPVPLQTGDLIELYAMREARPCAAS